MLKFGIIGEFLSHSRSPEIHSALLNEAGLSGTYEKIEIPKDGFPEAFERLKNSGYDGLNVTIPYKETVIPYLDQLSKETKYIGAVNTVKFCDGKALGFNTDYHGFKELLKTHNIEVKGKEALILGAGGAAKSAIKALLDEGVFDITVVSRSKQNFHSQYTISYEYLKESGQYFDIMVNCTPIGMYPNVDESPIDKDDIRCGCIIDLIYNPKQTLLLQYAEALNIKGVNGEVMLLAQAKESQKIWLSE